MPEMVSVRLLTRAVQCSQCLAPNRDRQGADSATCRRLLGVCVQAPEALAAGPHTAAARRTFDALLNGSLTEPDVEFHLGWFSLTRERSAERLGSEPQRVWCALFSSGGSTGG